ncbi:LPS assembly lipoprotein LptE [Thalassotalea atypica]|uniref:LPS-assembly lipoprotein LptE n=1 Tax=Thalassotalea atypica TaxID=2054316 RepID=UPI0025733B08|nr:LPS assembly lipoprotein LptE [Thalassotalea atypica]
MLITALLTGCGFHLRGDFLLPPELQTLYVSSVDRHGELTRLVKNHFAINKVNLVKSSQGDIPELKILKDNLNRRTLSVFPNGQVAEYELIYSVRYQLKLGNDSQQYSFELNRDYQDDPDKALAKSRELSLILSELRQEAADRILRDLSSYKANI